ncbi:MAG: PDC sensor domain-containing protein, partial [Candidatus Accumulibacter sp.]|uniref:PDC sensor domain-containing protein n=1 Tax=Accumulibacter sp. TaxID=2053492 RepID=UPI001A3B00CD
MGWRFTLAGVLPLLLVAALLMWVMLPQVMADIEARHQALARAIAGQVEEYLRSAGRELSAVAEYLGQRGDQPARVSLPPILDAHAGAGEVFAAIYVVAADDAVCAVGLPLGMRRQRDDLLEVDLSRWAILRQARERQVPVWSEVFLSAVSARLAVSLAIPVADQVLIGEVAIDG